jgi:YqxM protein
MKRLRKFRNKNYYYLMFMKIGIIFYLSTFTILHLTGTTKAYFSDQAEVTGVFNFSWVELWDKSSLEFTNSKVTGASQCTPVEAVIKNGGDRDMKGTVVYEVWWAEKGNPKDGVKVAEGQVKALKSGETETLTFTPNKNGYYKFKAMQRPGHPGQGELWSESIAVSNCGDSSGGQNEGNPEPPPTEEPKKKDEPANSPVRTEEPVEPPPTEQVESTEQNTSPAESESASSDKEQTQEHTAEEPSSSQNKE